MTYELHPLCTLFPRLSEAEAASLRDDIMANGLRQPIILHKGMILDGGNRYRACVDAGVEPKFVEFDGENIVSFVLSANLHRRHLSAGQQAAIVASAQDWAKAQTVGNPSLTQKCNVAPLDTAASRAAESGASLRTQKMADKVAKADPELAKQVAHGEVSLPKAVAKVEGKKATKPKQAAKQPDPDPEEYFGPSEDEIAQAEADARADVDGLLKLAQSDDALAAAIEENIKLRARVDVLESARDGYMNQCNELRSRLKARDRQIAALERKLKEAA